MTFFSLQPPFTYFIYALYTTDMLFSRFFTLLSTLVTVNTTYAFYFFLLHHCTNSLSSLHIFVHHWTFCASLHVKTSPDSRCYADSHSNFIRAQRNFYSASARTKFNVMLFSIKCSDH